MPINEFIKEMREENRQKDLSRMPVETRLARLEEESQALRSLVTELQGQITNLKRENSDLRDMVYRASRGEEFLV